MADEEFDLEGLSPQEIEEAIKDSPQLQKVYKSMQAGWTKKRQSESKQLTDLQGQVDELTKNLEEWGTWYSQVEPYLKSISDQGDQGDQGDRGDQSHSRKGKQGDQAYEQLLDRFTQLENYMNTSGSSIMNKLSSHERMFDLTLQLNDLYRKAAKDGKELDAKKVLQLALDKGYKNLEDAYDVAYRDDYIKSEVDKQTKEKVDAELLKHKTEVETGSGYQPTHMERIKDAPKTFSEATKQALQEVKKE